MRILLILIFAFIAQISYAQNQLRDSTANVLNIIGVWTNISNSTKTKSSDKTTESIPKIIKYIELKAGGEFRDPRYSRAIWKIENNRFIITTMFGEEIIGVLQKNDSTHTYLLTYNGETFAKKFYEGTK